MIKKFFKKYFNKFKKGEREKIYFALDTAHKSSRTKLKNVLTSKEAAGAVRGVAKTGVTVFKTASNVGSISIRNFRYRSIMFWGAFVIIMICTTVFFIRAAITIADNPKTFSEIGGQNQNNYITFKYSADGIRNKYYKNDPADYDADNSALSATAKTLIQSEVTDILAGDKLVMTNGHSYAASDYTFTADPENYSINVAGSFKAITSLTVLEQKYYMPDSINNIITITDQYGRPMFYGENYVVSADKTNMMMDPTQMQLPTFTLHTKSIPQQNASLDGQSLWQIAGNGKYWGQELKGTVFSNASVVKSQNSMFDHVSFTISSDGFFTAFTQYLNIMLSDYKYHHQAIGTVFSKDYNAKKGATYKPNANPKTDDDINNVYIQSLTQFQPILIWINQANIFTVTHSLITGAKAITYTFHWANTAPGHSFQSATHDFIYNAKKVTSGGVVVADKKARTAGNFDKGKDLDPTGNYWYFGKGGKDETNAVQKASGFTSDSDDAPNFLDLGFDHLTAFAMDAPGLANAKKDDTSKNPKDDILNKFVTNQWIQPKLLPYKNATGKIPGADYLNTNYNQAHIFADSKGNWFSLAYGQTDQALNGLVANRAPVKHEKNKDAVVKKEASYPFLITPDLNPKATTISQLANPYPSYYGYVSADGKSIHSNSSSRLITVARQVSNACGLVGVVSVDATTSTQAGLKKIAFDNAIATKLKDDNQHDYYTTTNWGAFIPTNSNPDYKPPDPKVKVAPDQTQKSLSIASYYGLSASRCLNLDVEYVAGIRYNNNSTSPMAVNITLLVICGVFLIAFFGYIIFRYKLLSVMIIIMSLIFLMLTVIFIANSGTPFTYSNISIICFGLLLLLLSINISISVFRKRAIAFFRNATDKLVISKTMIVLFLNYFALIFIESVLLAAKFGTNNLAASLILMAAMMVVIFLLVPIFLIFYLQTSLINPDYESDIDKLTVKALQPGEYNHLEKLVYQRGLAAHIKNRKQLLEYFAISHEPLMKTRQGVKIAKLKQLQNNSQKAIELQNLQTSQTPQGANLPQSNKQERGDSKDKNNEKEEYDSSTKNKRKINTDLETRQSHFVSGDEQKIVAVKSLVSLLAKSIADSQVTSPAAVNSGVARTLQKKMGSVSGQLASFSSYKKHKGKMANSGGQQEKKKSKRANSNISKSLKKQKAK